MDPQNSPAKFGESALIDRLEDMQAAITTLTGLLIRSGALDQVALRGEAQYLMDQIGATPEQFQRLAPTLYALATVDFASQKPLPPPAEEIAP